MSASPIAMPQLHLQPASSAQPVILLRVWATAASPSIAGASALQHSSSPPTLRLVQATEEPAPVPVRKKAGRHPGLAFYRKYTETLLQRYLKMSLDAARVPSFLGRELFSGHLMSHQMRGFDDGVIFVHDVGRCLDLLEPGLKHLVRRIALEGHTQQEVSALHGIPLRTVIRKYAQAMDTLTGLLIDRRLMAPTGSVESCQAK